MYINTKYLVYFILLLLGESFCRALNRVVEVSVSTAWPTTFSYPLCEALAYFDTLETLNDHQKNEKNHRKISFLTSLANLSGDLESSSQGRKRAIEAAIISSRNSTLFVDSFDSRMLNYTLSTRAYAPYCEMQRNLAKDTITELGINPHARAFVVLEKTIKYADNVESLISLSQEELNNVNNSGACCNRLDFEDILMNGVDSSRPLLILYADLKSKEFERLFKTLLKMSNPFLVRYIGVPGYSQSNMMDINHDVSTTLQGYGVRIDIRNLEYTSFDENKVEPNKKKRKMFDLDNNRNVSITDIKTAFIHGFDPDLLQSHPSSLDGFLNDYLPNLNIDIDNFAIPTIPIRSELQMLPLQVTSSISRSMDPLWTMQVISQNLPSFANSLSKLKLTESFVSEVKELYANNPHLSQIAGKVELFVNGRYINIERPSFNLFELIHIIREEESMLNTFYSELNFLGKEARAVVSDLICMGKKEFLLLGTGVVDLHLPRSEPSIRIDVGSGYKGAVIYLNDIEKDPEYRQWPSSVQQMLMMMQFGSPPTIRRNMLTVLLVIDPFDSSKSNIESLGLLFSMIQSGFPLRIGVIIAGTNDLNVCRDFFLNNSDQEDCNSIPHSFVQRNEKDMMKEIVSSETIMKLLQFVTSTYGKGISLPFLILMISSIKDDIFTYGELLNVYDDITKRLGVRTTDIDSKLIDALKSSTNANIETYQNGLRFLVKKNILPGMSFVNGVPFSSENAQELIMEEMQCLVEMILSHKITDTSPRSVYATILKQNNAHERMHPLLSESAPIFHRLAHGVQHDEVFSITSNQTIHFESSMLFEYGVSFINKSSIEFLKSFLKSLLMLSKNKLFFEDLAISARVVPTDVESSKTFCAALFRRSSRYDILKLIRLVDKCFEYLDRPMKELMTGNKDDDLREIVTGDDCLQNDLNCFYESILPGTLIANGRLYNPGKQLSELDLRVLFSLQRDVSITLATVLLKHDITVDAVQMSRSVAYINQQYALERFSSNSRTNALGRYSSLVEKESPLSYKWNMLDHGPRVKIISIVDPSAEAAQRAAPILRMLRDDLRLPLNVILAPQMSLDDVGSIPIGTYYRFFTDLDHLSKGVRFQGLPVNHVLTMRMDVPEQWDVQQSFAVQDTDNLRCGEDGCGDLYHSSDSVTEDNITRVEYSLNHLLFSGQCYDLSERTHPNGLQISLGKATIVTHDVINGASEIQISPSGTLVPPVSVGEYLKPVAETLVMNTVGYWQIRSNPGIWTLEIAKGSRGEEIYNMISGNIEGKGITNINASQTSIIPSKTLILKDFASNMEVIFVKKKIGFEGAKLLIPRESKFDDSSETIHVFSLATGHLYERLLKIMMLSVIKRTSTKVKFWLLENFLSPTFKKSAFAMSERYGFDVEFVTYKWPEWLRGQSEKQRIIWGYKILFLDVLFPLGLKRVIYVDADQVVRADLKELWNMDLNGAPYAYTPMCQSREETKDYRFWTDGFWKKHLKGKPYHISALYVVDLERFRQELVGDQLRATYQQLTADPNNLSNLDQDLPNYVQHSIKIFSLPQEWLWCESWCSDETKAAAKTIDLCNNPLHKESKVSMAKRIISGDLFQESWTELNEEVEQYDQEWSLQLNID